MTRFLFCLTSAGFLLWGALSDERMGTLFTRTIASGPCQSNNSGVQVPQNSDHIFYCLIWDSPNLEGQVPIFVSQEQGGPVIPPGTGFPFCRLLQLAGLWWRYSNPPLHESKDFEVEVEVNLRPTLSRPVRLGIGPPYGTLDQLLSCSSFFCWQLLDYSS
jgi:hypothetical protein